MGVLHLLTTPIGNLSDITKRVEDALREGQIFYVEDTRVFKSLLNALEIPLTGKSISSFHEHSKDKVIEEILSHLKEEHVYLASDAGGPLISDPHFPVVRKALDQGLEIETYPGVSAVTTGLELSGLPPYPFSFYGFLPREKSKIEKQLREALGQQMTSIFFESPERIHKTLEVISQHFPETKVAVIREMTKKFQTSYRFLAGDYQNIKDDIKAKGEFVLLIHPSKDVGEASVEKFDPETKRIAGEIYEKGARPKLVAKLIAKHLSLPVDDVYKKLSHRK